MGEVVNAVRLLRMHFLRSSRTELRIIAVLRCEAAPARYLPSYNLRCYRRAANNESPPPLRDCFTRMLGLCKGSVSAEALRLLGGLSTLDGSRGFLGDC